jgi:hypothetical protein
MVQCARIEENTNRVLEVIESSTLKWCKKYLEGTWVKNSTDKHISTNCIYYPERDTFSYEKPYPSWTLDDKCVWQPPVPYPDDYLSKKYNWDEDNQKWLNEQLPE